MDFKGQHFVFSTLHTHYDSVEKLQNLYTLKMHNVVINTLSINRVTVEQYDSMEEMTSVGINNDGS